MNGNALLTALELPVSSCVNQRVSKKFLIENGASTAADRKNINDGIEELFWVASLKPTTIGVPEYRDITREYLEIVVLRLALRTGAKATRLIELVHRAIPYPVLLLTEQDARTDLSAAHKRWAQNEGNKVVLDDNIVGVECEDEQDAECWLAFSTALALDKQPKATLYTLYQGWIDTLLALKAAQITGTFRLAENPDHATARHEALCEFSRMTAEISRLRSAAKNEKQIARQVELNLDIKRLEAALSATRMKL